MAINFGNNLKQIRSQKGIAQGELAEMIDMHATHLSRYERNVTAPSIDMLKKLADALGVTTDMLIYGSADEKIKGAIKDHELLTMFSKVQTLEKQDVLCVKSFLHAFIFHKELKHQMA